MRIRYAYGSAPAVLQLCKSLWFNGIRDAVAEPASRTLSLSAVTHSFRRRHSIGRSDHQLENAFVVLSGETLDAVDVPLDFVGAFHVGCTDSRSHRLAQAAQANVGLSHRLPAGCVDDGESSDLKGAFGVECCFAQLGFSCHQRCQYLRRRKNVAPSVLDYRGLGSSGFELAEHERVCRGDDISDGLALRSAVGVEGAAPFADPRQPVRHRRTKNTAADIRQSSRKPCHQIGVYGGDGRIKQPAPGQASNRPGEPQPTRACWGSRNTLKPCTEPPWEQFESGEQPFFKQHKPAIAAMTSETRKKAIAALQSEDPAIFARWRQYRSLQGRMAHYAKSCGRFTRTSGKVNTYVLFTELAAKSSVHVGLIVKSGIAVDASQSPVWNRLLDDDRVREVLDMVNQERSGKRVFPAVAAVERFSILHLGPRAAGGLQASMLNFGVAEATASEVRSWSRRDLRIASPRTNNLLSSSDKREIELALMLQDRFSPLDFADPDGANPWGLKYVTLFNSSNAKESGDLVRGPTLEEQKFHLDRDKRYRHPDGRIAVPVYEGQMANRWDHRARTYEGFTGRDRYGRKPHIPWVTDEQHAKPDFEIEPRYWMHETVANDRFAEVVGEGEAIMALRDIGAVWTNRRTLRVAIIEPLPATHTLPVLVVPTRTVTAAAALLNSMTLDFLVRLHMPGGHVTTPVLTQCAAPPPSEISSRASEAAAQLSLTSTRLAAAVGQQLHPWDPARRENLDASCDALIANAYGLTMADYEIVLDHFKLLEKIETRACGEYRSKRLRLEAFEQIGEGR